MPPVFGYMQRIGNVDAAEMDRTFNMGIGMVAVVAADDVARIGSHLDGLGEAWFEIGDIVAGAGEVVYG